MKRDIIFLVKAHLGNNYTGGENDMKNSFCRIVALLLIMVFPLTGCAMYPSGERRMVKTYTTTTTRTVYPDGSVVYNGPGVDAGEWQSEQYTRNEYYDGTFYDLPSGYRYDHHPDMGVVIVNSVTGALVTFAILKALFPHHRWHRSYNRPHFKNYNRNISTPMHMHRPSGPRYYNQGHKDYRPPRNARKSGETHRGNPHQQRREVRPNQRPGRETHQPQRRGGEIRPNRNDGRQERGVYRGNPHQQRREVRPNQRQERETPQPHNRGGRGEQRQRPASNSS